ncbi:DUF2721 domain-containing protein [Acuticoccus sp. M5D2P5]|uniref:DUF2721 domain-containing protein n=1 Tax=Acuticoccus kalidii TaxID=2910977 RepID=UPI001F1F3FCB|nr:DUF2721 domain-containing protein [Acuticoccus kalidii]MCF3932587.1 DUF2721 domain-containing protein [Acuticoccus kalidii]
MDDVSTFASVSETIRIAFAPIFLLAGIGAMLNVMTGRLGRIVNRARVVLENARMRKADRADCRLELALIDKRILAINLSIILCVASALATCLLVALLFISEMMHLEIASIVATAFVTSMVLLMAGLICFLVEVRLSLRALHFSREKLPDDD